jgi:signal transduction histidine kinase
MSAEVAARAFEPFFSTKPEGSGTGLGLAFVARLVSDLNGSIEIESAPGRGTTIRLVLPAA